MVYVQTLENGSILGGEFRVNRLLGSGGFANTYHATDLTLQRDVAIKEYFPNDIAFRSTDSSVQLKSQNQKKNFEWGLKRFVQEARTLAKFRHPNIVRVHRTLEANGTAYMILDFVQGVDMDVWLKNLGRIPTQEELDGLAVPLLDAMALVHSKEIFHRDIKPANIFVREEDGRPILLDFGAARFAVGEAVGTTAAIVSRGYSAHEAYSTDYQLQGAWTDIYGFAATLYRTLSGDAPTESAARVLNDTMVPATELPLPKGAYRSSFLKSIDWGLAIMPADRPQTVADWQPALVGEAAVPDSYISQPSLIKTKLQSKLANTRRKRGVGWISFTGGLGAASAAAALAVIYQAELKAGLNQAGVSWTESGPVWISPWERARLKQEKEELARLKAEQERAEKARLAREREERRKAEQARLRKEREEEEERRVARLKQEEDERAEQERLRKKREQEERIARLKEQEAQERARKKREDERIARLKQQEEEERAERDRLRKEREAEERIARLKEQEEREREARVAKLKQEEEARAEQERLRKEKEEKKRLARLKEQEDAKKKKVNKRKPKKRRAKASTRKSPPRVRKKKPKRAPKNSGGGIMLGVGS